MKNITPPSWDAPGFDFRWVARGLALLLLVWFVLSGIFTVPADSVAVITRFGAYVGQVKPGLHFKFPLGIDKATRIPVTRQEKLEFGFGTPNHTHPDQVARSSNEQSAERSMVTGDLNMAQVEWVIQYRIEDPYNYLFKVNDPGSTLRDASESVMREVVGDRTVDEILTIGRQDVENVATEKLKEIARKYELGMSIIQVQLKNVQPPKQVQASFNQVNQAQQEREQAINVARGEYNKAVPQARGIADQRISTAEGYALRRVNEARGDAERFTAQLAEYLKAPEVTRDRLYLETLAEVLPQVERKVFIDRDASQFLPLLPVAPR